MRTDTAIPSQHRGRLLHTVYGWYALTREQADLGPFKTAGEASRALTRHIHIYKGLNMRDPDQKASMHLHDSEHCVRNNCALCVEARVAQQSMLVAV